MKYYYAIRTSFHGSNSVARFASLSDRETFVREFGVPVIDPNMGACWDTGRKSAEAAKATHARARAANREEMWLDEEFDVKTYEGETTATLSYEIAL